MLNPLIQDLEQGARNRRERQLTRFALPYDYTCFADGTPFYIELFGSLVGPHRKNMFWLNFFDQFRQYIFFLWSPTENGVKCIQ